MNLKRVNMLKAVNKVRKSEKNKGLLKRFQLGFLNKNKFLFTVVSQGRGNRRSLKPIVLHEWTAWFLINQLSQLGNCGIQCRDEKRIEIGLRCIVLFTVVSQGRGNRRSLKPIVLHEWTAWFLINQLSQLGNCWIQCRDEKRIEIGLRCILFGASIDELRGGCPCLPNGNQVVRKWKEKGECT